MLQNKLRLLLASHLLLCPRSGCSSLLYGLVCAGKCSAGYIFVSIKCNSSVQMAWFRINLAVNQASLFRALVVLVVNQAVCLRRKDWFSFFLDHVAEGNVPQRAVLCGTTGIFMACAEQSWWLHGVWVAETFLCILSARDTSLLFFVFRPITLISLSQGRNSSPQLI